MGFFSKVFKGIKGAIKDTAKRVKTVAKKLAYATPGGKAMWNAGSEIGKGLSNVWGEVKKGYGKLSQKLGPMGTMALTFVLAPYAGAALSSMWGSFGATTAAWAQSANTIVSTLGTAGQSIYAAGNFIGGTLGAMGNAFSEGASNVMAGEFSAGAKAFASNMSSAFSGAAGSAAVQQGAAQAALEAVLLTGSSGATTATVDPMAWEGGFNLDSSAPIDTGFRTVEQSADLGMFGYDTTQGTLAQADAYTQFGAEGARRVTEHMALGEAGIIEKEGTEGLKKAGSLLAKAAFSPDQGYSSQPTGFDIPQVSRPSVQPLTSVGGTGSSGFSLLSGVQGLEESLRNSQNLMFS